MGIFSKKYYFNVFFQTQDVCFDRSRWWNYDMKWGVEQARANLSKFAAANKLGARPKILFKNWGQSVWAH